MKKKCIIYVMLFIVPWTLLLTYESRVYAASQFQNLDQCKALNQEEETLYYQSQYEQALQKFEEALACYQEIGDRVGESSMINNIGIIYHQQGHYDEALEFYQEALAIQKETGDRNEEGTTLNNIGGIYSQQGHYNKALEFYQEALTIRQEVGNRAEEGVTLNNIGGVYYDQGNYDQALEFYQQALTIRREVEDRFGEGTTIGNIGLIYKKQGYYEKARQFYEQALTIAREINDRLGEKTMLNNIGSLYQAQGSLAEALDSYQQALSIDHEIGNRVGEGVSFNNIGNVYYLQGRYGEALNSYQQALEIRGEVGDRAGIGTTLNNIGIVYYSQGLSENALIFFQQALEVRREIGSRAAEGITLNNIGLIYHSQKHDEKALEFFKQALEIRRKVGDRIGEGTTLNNMGTIYDNQVRYYEKALQSYEQALTIARELDNRIGEARTLGNIGNIYQKQGRFDLGLDVYQQAQAILYQIGDRAGNSSMLSNIGSIYQKQGDYEEAFAFYQQALEVIEEIRSNIQLEELKTSFTAEQVDIYDHTISLLSQLERPEDAFNYVQRAKARTFLDQMANVRIDPKATDDPELLEREQELLGEIRGLEEVLFGRRDFATLPLEGTTRDEPPLLTGEQRNEVQKRLTEAYDEYEQLLIDIKLTNPQYASLRSVQASTLITVQQTLPPETTLVEYYVAPTQTFAFVVTPDEFHSVPISITAEALNSAIEGWRSYPALDDSVPPPSFELYDLLVAPVREHIHTDALYIAQAKVLHYLPFGALHDGERYLVEELAITYLPSASVLPYVLDNADEETSGQLLALANPEADGAPYLKHALDESEAIAELFNSQALTGTLATETVLVDQAPQASRVHLAAHGQFNQHAPQFSRIILSSDEKNDGYLEVHEIFSLDLPHADLVTLSACQTQLGELSAGDELTGLSRAFIYAGTPSLVASLWSVDDASTRFLMERFYGYLQAGKGKASALRQAQLDTMEEYPNPYHWAAFTLIGDMGEVEAITDVTDQEQENEVASEDVTDVEQEVSPAGPTSEDALVLTSDRNWLLLGGGALVLLLVVGGGLWMWKVRS